MPIEHIWLNHHPVPLLHHLSDTLIQYFILEQYSSGSVPKMETTHSPLCFETVRVVCSLCATISGSVIASFCTVFSALPFLLGGLLRGQPLVLFCICRPMWKYFNMMSYVLSLFCNLTTYCCMWIKTFLVCCIKCKNKRSPWVWCSVRNKEEIPKKHLMNESWTL